MTLAQALAAHVRLIVWCKSCNHRAEPDLATQVAQHGAGMPVPDWARLLRCTECKGAGCGFCRQRCETLAAPSPFELRPIELHDVDADCRTQTQVFRTFAAKVQYYVINRLVLILSDIGEGLPHDSFQS